MKKLLTLLFIFCSLWVTAQSVDGGLKTLTASGTDTYTITEALPAAYDPKERFLVRFTNANTGAATLNRAGLGAKDIKSNSGGALSSGDITAGETKLLSYNGTYYQIVGGGGSSTVTLTGDVTGSGTGSFATTIKTDVALAGNPTTTTQSADNNSTRIATTAYADLYKFPRYPNANRQTTSYQLVLTDDAKIVEMNVGSANNLTVPPNSTVAFPLYTLVRIAQYGSGQTTVVAGSGVTIRSSSGVLTCPAQYTEMLLYKIGTNEWYLWNGLALPAGVLSKVDDTNVTLTLGGSPSAALLASSSLTLGWTGQLAVARGGTGVDNTTQTYTPTLTNTANVAASTPRLCTYMRVGNVITVSGQLDIDPTTTLTLTTLGISLPIASALTTAYQLGGSGAASTVTDGSLAIFADATNDRATMQYICVDITNHTITFTFSYQVL